MAYTPTEWENGDTVTAELMNKIEQGIADAGSGYMMIECTNESADTMTNANGFTTGDTLNKTYAEIFSALQAGVPCFVHKTVNSDSTVEAYHTAQSVSQVIGVYKYDTYFKVYVQGYYVTSTTSRGGSYIYDGSAPAVAVFKVDTASEYPTFQCTIFPSDLTAADY